MKTKLFNYSAVLLLGCLLLMQQNAFAVDGANQQEDLTLTIPTVTDVSLTPSANTFGVLDAADFAEAVNDPSAVTGHVISIGDGYNGGGGISFVQTNSTATSGYDHVRVDFTAVDGTDTIAIVDNAPTFTLTIADVGGIASADILISADSNPAADPLMEDDAAATTDFSWVDADTVQCNAIDFDGNGQSWLDMRFDLDESTIDFSDQPTSLDLRITVTIADS